MEGNGTGSNEAEISVGDSIHAKQETQAQPQIISPQQVVPTEHEESTIGNSSVEKIINSHTLPEPEHIAASPAPVTKLPSGEQAQVTSKELFPPVSPIEQIRSCYKTLGNIVDSYDYYNLSFNEQELAAIDLYKSLLKKISSDPVLRNDPLVAEKAIKITVALLDSSVVDEIVFHGPDEFHGKDQYFREYGYYVSPEKDFRISKNHTPRILFTIGDEQQKTLDQLQQQAKTLTVTSVKDLKHHRGENPDVIVFSQGSDIKQIDKMMTITMETFPQTPIAAPFSINENVGGLLLENTDSAKYGTFDHVFYPRTELPRQEVWMALLGKGKRLFEYNHFGFLYGGKELRVRKTLPDEETSTSSDLSRELDEYWKMVDLQKEGRYYRYLRRKTGVWLQSTEEKIAQFYNRHVEHYRRVVADRLHPTHGEAEVILTRSGVSANEAAIRATAHSSGSSKQDRPPLYVMNGFYFENTYGIYRDFNITEDPNQARVFLINNEPSDPFESLSYPDPYIQTRDTLLQDIITKAKNDPDNQYYVMYDKTTNLLKQTFTNEDHIPANLTVLETGSLTKHQRGGKNYFFGVIAAWGNQEFKQQLSHDLSEVRGNLTPLGTIHLPRLTKEEIATRNAELAKKTQVISEEVEKVQAEAGIPEKYRWKMQNQTYFAWFLPPTQALLDKMTKPNSRARKNLEKEFKAFFPTHLGFDPALIDTALEQIGTDTPTVFNGDSFGLDATVTTKFQANSTNSDVDPVFREFGVLRIAPGAKTTEEELRIYIDKVMGVVTEKLKRFLEAEEPRRKAA